MLDVREFDASEGSCWQLLAWQCWLRRTIPQAPAMDMPTLACISGMQVKPCILQFSSGVLLTGSGNRH